MPVRSADAQWNGNLKQGDGTVRLESGAFEGQYSFNSRFEEGAGTNPEELLGAAHAGCNSMALANILAEAGHAPESVKTTARVHLEDLSITKIDLHTEGEVPGIDDREFQNFAEDAKENCIVSQALSPKITLEAKLKAGAAA